MVTTIPYRISHYHTTLPEQEIRAAVEKNAHLGQWEGMLIKSKPYYGELSAGYFTLRASGRFKKHSHSPSLIAWFSTAERDQRVELSLRPHPLLLALGVLFVGASAFFLLLNIFRFFGNWDIAPIFMSSFIVAIMVALFVMPYHTAAEKTLRFWIRELKLESDTPK